MDSSSVGVIVARGASKRVPRKVIRPLLGVPLLVWAARAAQQSNLDQIILSTEDEEIAEIAREWGINVPFLRPKSLSYDYVSPDEVIVHALDTLIEQSSKKYEYVALIQPTAPFIVPESINECLKQIKSTNSSCCFLARYASELPEWMFYETADNSIKLMLDGNLSGDRQHTQLIKRPIIPAGAVWVMRDAILRRENKIYVDPMSAVVIPREQAVDIDEEFDFIVAEAMAYHYELIPPQLKKDPKFPS